MSTEKKLEKSNEVINLTKAQGVPTSNFKEVTTAQLFGEAGIVFILHLGERYSLSITKQKKLLLTKEKYHF